MSDVLDKICADKRREIARRKAARPMAEVESAARAASPPRGFQQALVRAAAAGRYGLIAEIKKASPSKGLIRADFDPPGLARAYLEGGASCLSVLTDTTYFQGRDSDLTAAREAAPLPVLRKDFMLDPYQIVEARGLGADCILLIIAALDDLEAEALEAAARSWQMDVLVEVHGLEELERASRLQSRLIGVNNRNLQTLEVDIGTSEALAGRLPAGSLGVSESGLHTPADLARMARAGFNAFLVGESLMRQDDVRTATETLLAKAQTASAAGG